MGLGIDRLQRGGARCLRSGLQLNSSRKLATGQITLGRALLPAKCDETRKTDDETEESATNRVSLRWRSSKDQSCNAVF
jgi:hypothetical protein